jgi:hypothetical protein
MSTLPVLFVGSSTEAVEFVNGLQLNLWKKAQIRPWNQVDYRLSRDVLDKLEKELSRADFAAFVFAPDDVLTIRGDTVNTTRDNVLFELGFFMGGLGRDRVFIVYPIGMEEKLHLPIDLHGLTVAEYPHDDFDPKEANAQLVMGTASTRIHDAMRRLGPVARPTSASQRRIASVLGRGDTSSITTLADAAIHVEDCRHNYPDELKRRLRNNELLPTKFLYWTTEGSSHWIRVCERESYVFYKSSLGLIKEKANEIANQVVQATRTAAVDFISLGSGDGEKDNYLLKALEGRLTDDSLVYYYPIDISDALIVRAIPRAMGSGLVRSKFRCKALLADFRHLQILQKFYEERPAKNIFSVLGNTIGNADEAEIIRALSDAMLPGDLLLIEFNTSPADERDELLRDQENMEHDFTPLASLNVPWDESKMKYSLVRDASVIPQTQSMMAQYSDAIIDNKIASDIKLSVVHHYNFDAFKRAIESRIRVKTIYEFDRNGVGLLLAQRK